MLSKLTSQIYKLKLFCIDNQINTNDKYEQTNSGIQASKASLSVVIEPQRGEATARGVFQFWRVSRYVDAPGARSAQRTIHKITCPGSRVRLASGPLAPRRLTSLSDTWTL